MRRLLTAAVIAASLLPIPARAAVAVLVIDGRGYGHGVGMAQDGAFWMGKGGSTTDQILGQFYPGTKTGKASGTIRVPVLDAGGSASLAFPEGGEVRGEGPGFPVKVPAGGEVRVAFRGGEYHVQGGERARSGQASGPVRLASTSQEEPPPLFPGGTLLPPLFPEPTTTTEPPVSPPTDAPAEEDPAQPVVAAAPVWAVPDDGGTVSLPARQRRYRGMMEATAANGTLRLVNQVDVEQYLKGMGEVRDPSWPAASLRSQAIAARTYGLRAMAASGEVCETQRCQVYLGAQAEYGAMNKAVDATRGQVLMFGRGLASAVYSSNGGGFSASQEEGFGVVGVDVPYLRPAAYTTSDPVPWTVRVALKDLRQRFGYPGQLTDVRASRTGPSGRVLEVTLDGEKGSRAVPGIAFDASLSLRSTLFTLRVEQGDAPPPPPEGESAVQLPPGGVVEGEGGPAPNGTAVPEVAAAAPDAQVASQPAPSDDGPPRAAVVVAAWSLLAVVGTMTVVVKNTSGGDSDRIPAESPPDNS